MNLYDFIEYDNHNGVTLLKTCLMNAFNKAYYEDDVEIRLYYIPFSLIDDCLQDSRDNWKSKEEWKDKSFKITVTDIDTDSFLFKIYGDVKFGKVTISNRKSPGIS